jgi:hypothetical protein
VSAWGSLVCRDSMLGPLASGVDCDLIDGRCVIDGRCSAEGRCVIDGHRVSVGSRIAGTVDGNSVRAFKPRSN